MEYKERSWAPRRTYANMGHEERRKALYEDWGHTSSNMWG